MTYATIDLNSGELFVEENTGDLAAPRPVLNEEQLLEQLIRLNREINVRKADIAQLLKDTKYHKKSNPAGLPVDVCKKTAKTAVRYAAADYEEKKLEQLEFFAFYERATGYDD